MAQTCPRCLMTFTHHLVVPARCSKRWRGANFDQASAEANIGAALARHWNLDPRSQAGLQALFERALVKSYGERRDTNPTHAVDPSEGEEFEFHVGLRVPLDDAALASVRETVEGAVKESRHFSLR